MRSRLPMDDGRQFITALEAAFENGDADAIEHQMPRLERLILQYQNRIYELAQLQYRARLIRERHEPAGDRR